MNPGSVCKIFLRWKDPWWRCQDLPATNFSPTFAWSRNERESASLPAEWFKWIYNLTEVEGHDDVMVCWVTGEGAKVADEMQDQQVISYNYIVKRNTTANDMKNVACNIDSLPLHLV